MSRAKAEAERVPLDAYMTPAPLALAICAELRRRVGDPLEIIEPSAGGGAFVRAARATWAQAHITAVEIDRNRKPECLEAGANLFLGQCWVETAIGLANAQSEEGNERLIVGNPPFREAERHIVAALDLLRDGDHLALLLRLNLLGSMDRVRFWRRCPPTWVKPTAPRPSFTGGGTDGTEYALFCWKKGARGRGVILQPLVWKPARRTRRDAWESRSAKSTEAA